MNVPKCMREEGYEMLRHSRHRATEQQEMKVGHE